MKARMVKILEEDARGFRRAERRYNKPSTTALLATVRDPVTANGMIQMSLGEGRRAHRTSLVLHAGYRNQFGYEGG
ncbi:hypothetical protein JAAARDRAFT_43153 [Jaapia argillacea MUCL 33604]|uniref:Uncharacterized protein n=1 Tax=Jaapia argillacea MUCL 33604 TaxID=933084 RepID=A0A067PET6_9AGAM|nr:hypothetical protein JAAARDRAFT_43153 [Jaapia argillacea MUCL 33604]